MGSDEAPRINKYLIINGISAILFWLTLGAVKRGPGIVVQTVLKLIMYLAIILWLNSGFYLSMSASGIDVESWGFQREQVKLTLWIIVIFIVMELPMWLTVLSVQ